ncbi:MAG: hypothetical protein HYR70_07090 [Chloroflexi bacterium]|nr:hypothetical protein [Chloroflexota bacterium]MBI3340903.1 hypothetical protein [Chloroflexota bacterium]
MNERGGAAQKTPSAWEIESKRFKELYDRWLDFHLNKFFDLSIDGPGRRLSWIIFLGGAFIVFGSIVHILLYTFLTLGPARQPDLFSLAVFAGTTFVRMLLLLLIPALIAINMAGNYLADIFNLKKISVAWKFIGELSLGGANEVLHIRDGKVAEEDKESPILLIGGPGRVEVEFDTAALFERPDGIPHVIGPEEKKSDEEEKKAKKDRQHKDNATLDGFERLREPIINLRDQYFGNPSTEAITVEGRSLDGIQVNASDVRALFSIRRDGHSDSQKPTKERPYLYNPQSVHALIYQQSVPVLSQGPNPSGEPSSWTGAMRGLLNGSIGEFMSQNRLAEYLASISTLEIENSEFKEDTILWQTVQYSSELPDAATKNITKPKFHPRTELSDRFMKYSNGFSKKAGERGINLHWVGVGTWKIPNKTASDFISGQHIQAWQINRENAARSDTQALQEVMEEAELNEKLRLIQTVPFEAYRQNRAKYSEKEKAVKALLHNYWDQLGDALLVYYNGNPASGELGEIEKAVLIIERLLNIPEGQHTVGGGSFSKIRQKHRSPIDENSPPAPSSYDEVLPYLKLLAKLTELKVDFKAVEPMLENEAKRHPGLTPKERIERIVKRLERYGK